MVLRPRRFAPPKAVISHRTPYWFVVDMDWNYDEMVEERIMDKEQKYAAVLQSIRALVEGEEDCIAVMSTIACELYHAFPYFNWVGFYRLVNAQTLKVGPYQGSHGCLTIDIHRGVCGACVRTASIQLENDVSQVVDHIACSSETKAEIVLPIMHATGDVVAVLDIDSIEAGVFDETDVLYLQAIVAIVQRVHGSSAEV